MKLPKENALAAVHKWALGREPVWSQADIDALCTRMIAMSSLITPHIVMDVALDAPQIQQVLLARVLSTIDEWLVRAAAGVRASLRLRPVVRTENGSPALGLRSATLAELDAIEGMGRETIADVARTLALHTGIRSIDHLDAVPGLGATRLKSLKAKGYLDQPIAMLVSPSLLAFVRNPTLSTFLTLMDRTDLELSFGDSNSLQLHPPQGGAPIVRLVRLLTIIQDDAQRRLSPAAGMLASHAQQLLRRDSLIQRYRNELVTTNGEVVISGAYREAMINLVNGAARTIRLAHFVATASHSDNVPGSLTIIEAIEARAAAGVEVRVILDRDRPGDPYLSHQINKPVITRLRAAGVKIKEDPPATLLHLKLAISDGRRVMVGSHNLTTSSIARTHELSVILDSKEIVQEYVARFDNLWTEFT